MSGESVNKATKMAKTSAMGSIQLFIGQIASTIMLAVGTIIVGIYIDQSQYGLFVKVLVPIGTFVLFVDWGVGAALTKYVATFRAERSEDELRKLITAGLTFAVATGLVLTLISLLTANFISETILGSSEITLLVVIASTSIIFTSIYSCSRSIFVGFERMKLVTVTVIISSIAQGLLSPLLVYMGFGALGAVIGFTVAAVSSGITALTLLYFAVLRKLSLGNISKTKLLPTLKLMLSYGIPLSIGTIISGFAPQISRFVMASYVNEAMIGNYRIALNFTVFITFFLYPIQTVLFPAFSKIDASNDKQLLKTVFTSSVKYSSFFLAPATIALMVLSAPIISTIYADKWSFAPLFLSLSVIGNLVVLFGNISINRLLYATGETKMLLKLSILTLVIEVPLAFLLIPPLGIIGVILVTSLISGLPSVIIGFYWTWKRFETKPDLSNSAKIFIASAISGLITYLFLNSFVLASWIMLFCGAILFLFVYVISIPLVGAVNRMDINNFRAMFSEMGPVSKLLEIPLKLLEIQVRLREKLLLIGYKI